MRRERGYKLVVLAVLVAVLAGAAWLIDARGYRRGALEERAAWQARESAELARANALIAELERRVRAQEAETRARLAAAAEDYEEKLRDAKRAHDAHLRALRAGALRLRDPAGAAACEGAGSDALPGTAAAARGGDARAPGELSGAAARFLLELTREADEVAAQLAACQRILRAERER